MPTNRPIAIKSAKGTIYFVKDNEGLKQGYNLTLHNPGSPVGARLTVRWGKEQYTCDVGGIARGESAVCVYIPDVREATRMTFSLDVPGSERLEVDHKPGRHWTVHLVQFAHHDFGFTDLPTNVLREFCGFYDDILRFCTETDHFPEESRFRYTIEQGWSLLYYLEHRPPEVREEMMRRIREERIEVNAFIGNEVTELLGPEEMIRMLYPVFELKRKYGIPVTCAEHNDIPGVSWGVAAAMAGAGVRYFAPAFPDYFDWGRTHRSFWDEGLIAPGEAPRAFYWEAPNGDNVLFWHGKQGPGGDKDVTLEDLPQYLERIEAAGYQYDIIRYQTAGGQRDNAPPAVGFAHTCREWNTRWTYPRLEQSLNSRFFGELETQLAPDTATYRGELPGTDYCVGACCTAYPSSLNRVTHDWLLAAERIAAIASEITSYKYPAEAISEAYYCTLMNDEHAWGVAHPSGPGQEASIAQHCEFAYRAAALADDVLIKAANEIADHITRADDGYYAVVFNPLNWRRTDPVTVLASPMRPCAIVMGTASAESERSDGKPPMLRCFHVSNRGMVNVPMELIEGGLDVIDLSTGASVPHQVYEVGSPFAPVPYAAYRHAMGQFHEDERYEVSFVAEDVPALGYKVYRFVPSKRPATKGGITIRESTLENCFYRLELDPETGAIRSIYDKNLDRELLDRGAPHAGNQIVIRSSITAQVQTSGKAVIERGRQGSVSGSLIVKTSAPGYPQITQEILLYSDCKRIDIGNRLLKDPSAQLETYFAFPFDFDEPRFRYEGSLSVIEPFEDQFPGSNTEYYAVQHWANVSDSKAGVTISSLEAPMMQFGGNWPLYVSPAHRGFTPPNSGRSFHTKTDVRKGHIYSLVLLNNYRTNFSPTQNGDVLFRYSITSHAGDWKSGKSRAFGYAVSLPLVHAAVNGKHEGSLPASSSFCEINVPNVLLLTLKRAEDGRGLIVRFMETEGKDTEFTIRLSFATIAEVWETNLVEDNQRIIPTSQDSVTLGIRAWGTATARIVLGI